MNRKKKNSWGSGVIITIVMVVDVFLQSYFWGGRGVINRGMSFGWFSGMNNYFVVATYLVILAWFFANRRGKFQLGLLALVLGGLGNLLPRLLLGGVWDYLYFPVLGFWFNLSDVLICVGVIIYLWSEIASCRARP